MGLLRSLFEKAQGPDRTSAPGPPAVRTTGGKRATDTYFERLNEPDRLRKAGKTDDALREAMALVELLPAVAKQYVKEYGRFDIRSIPPLDCACTLAAIRQDAAGLARTKSIVEDADELRPWRDLVASAYEDLNIVAEIRSYLEEHPGTLQSKLGKAIGVDGRRTSVWVKHLTDAKQLRREPSAKTYSLFVE